MKRFKKGSNPKGEGQKLWLELATQIPTKIINVVSENETALDIETKARLGGDYHDHQTHQTKIVVSRSTQTIESTIMEENSDDDSTHGDGVSIEAMQSTEPAGTDTAISIEPMEEANKKNGAEAPRCETARKTKQKQKKQLPENDVTVHQRRDKDTEGSISKGTTSQSTQTKDVDIQPTEESAAPLEDIPRKTISSALKRMWEATKCFELKKQLEKMVWFDFKVGLSLFTISEDGKMVTSWRAKVTFLLCFVCAVFDIVRDIGLLVWHTKVQQTYDLTLWCFALANELALLMVVFCHFAMIWWYKEKIYETFRRLRLLPPPQNNKTHMSGIIMRLTSIAMSVCMTLSGYSLNETYRSFQDLLEIHESQLYLAFVPSVYDNPDNTTAANLTIANVTTTSVPYTTTTRISNVTMNTTNPESVTGFFIKDGFLETCIFGMIGIIVDVVGQVIKSEVYDYLLNTSMTTWHYVQDLDVKDLTWTKEDDQWQGRRQRLRKKKRLAKARLARYDEIMEMTTDMNEYVRIFWPAVALHVLFLMSYLLHIIFQRKWRKAIYYGVRLTKLFIAFYYCLRIARKVESLNTWFASKDAKKLLNVDTNEFQRRITENTMRPIGVGSGMFLINAKFIAGLFGLIFSNILLVIQSWNSSTCSSPTKR